MVIRVPVDLEEQIRQKVESGDYRDPTDVLRVALRLLDARDERLHELGALVAEGLAGI